MQLRCQESERAVLRNDQEISALKDQEIDDRALRKHLSIPLEHALRSRRMPDLELAGGHNASRVSLLKERNHARRVGGDKDVEIAGLEGRSPRESINRVKEERDVFHVQESPVFFQIALAANAHLHTDENFLEKTGNVRIRETAERLAGIQKQLVQQIPKLVQVRRLLMPEIETLKG